MATRAATLAAPLPVASTLCGPRSALDVHRFNRKQARQEAEQLAYWLGVENARRPLKERDQVLRFFQLRKDLCALAGVVWGNLLNPDRFAFELNLGGVYRPDFVVGCTTSRNVLLVEFEDAQPKSLFERARDFDSTEVRPKLGRRLLGGMAQIADWVYFLETASDLTKKAWFTFEPRNVLSLLVVGREHYFDKLAGHDEHRYEWLQDKLRLGVMPVVIRTFDGLSADLTTRLATYK